MPNYFVIRTSDDDKEWVWEEFQRGRLRQGWGLSGMKLPSGEDTPEKMKEWCKRFRRRAKEFWQDEVSQQGAKTRYWILHGMMDVRTGDRIVIPKMPSWGSFCLAVAKGTYQFDAERRSDPKDDDFRHVVPIDGKLRIVSHLASANAQIVTSSLKGYQAAVNYVRKPEVRDAIEALLKSEAPAAPQSVAALFSEVGKAATEKIIDELVNQPQVLEDLVAKMIEHGGYRILRTRHFDSKGGDADIVAQVELSPLATAFEQQSILLIQVKKKTGIDNEDVTAVNQLVPMEK
jgi:Restriction endonuclease